MSEERKTVVTLKKGIRAEKFLDDMTSSYGDDIVPSRKVQIYNEKPDSISNFDFVMTKEEAEKLKKDPRVRDVRWGTKKENGFIKQLFVEENEKTYGRNAVDNTDDYPWQFPECTSQASRYPRLEEGTAGETINYKHTYNLDGSGVDVVIQDSGIENNNPEWLNRNRSQSRLKQIDWPSASGLSSIYNQGPNFYTDQNGHGTHVAGTTAGRLYGWAKGADIYASKIFDTDAFGESASFNMIRHWHNSKTNNRPTIVNMSWGYRRFTSSINGGNWRGTDWTGTQLKPEYGIIGNYHGSRVASVDSDVEDCLDAGIILVGAAGNYSHKIDRPDGIDYNNYYLYAGVSPTYYHQGSSPTSPSSVICVGAVSYAYSNYIASGTGNKEMCTSFSEVGPRVDVYAPGNNIQSVVAVGSSFDDSYARPYPEDSNFKVQKVSGTSMASPCVTGVLATILQLRPNFTQQDCINWLNENSAKDRLWDPTTGDPALDYTNLRSLQGSVNNYLNTPFVSPEVFNFKNIDFN